MRKAVAVKSGMEMTMQTVMMNKKIRKHQEMKKTKMTATKVLVMVMTKKKMKMEMMRKY